MVYVYIIELMFNGNRETGNDTEMGLMFIESSVHKTGSA
jgi:hypothetical protein